MKFLTLAAAAVAFSATSAFAQSAFDGTVGFNYVYAPVDTHDYQAQFDASAVFALSPALSVQVDLASAKDSDDDANFTYTVHGIYSVNNMLALGVFFSDQFGDSGYSYGGVELAYRNGNFEIEAHAEMEDIFDYGDYYNVGAQVGYTISALGSLPTGVTAYVGFNTQYEGPEIYVPSIYAGVKTTIAGNVGLDARVASMDGGHYMYYSLAVSYNFGNGSVFEDRSYGATFPGY